MTKPKLIDVKQFIELNASAPDFTSIVEEVRAGALFVYPTETIYGIGGVPTVEVEERIYSAKRRKPENPLLLIASSLKHFNAFDLEFSDTAKKLADAFWPGDLTMILPHKSDSSVKTGVRVSAHPFIKKICDALGAPLYSTSANISGEEYVNDPEFIFSTFEEDIDLLFSLGKLPSSEPSTVIEVCDNGKVNIIREGVIKKRAILNIV